MTQVKYVVRWLAPLLGGITAWVAFKSGMPRDAAVTLGITVLTALWWMTEAVAIPIASLVPIALLPLLGVLPAKTTVAQSYGHPLILLLMGGFFLSKGMEKSGVHRRLAIGMVRLCGGSSGGGTKPKMLMLGFMIASAVLSMWISNTATTLMLLPIALAVLGDQKGGVSPIAAPLMMGIAYAANIGGLGTPIGTPPNLVFIEQYEAATGKVMTFTEWMRYGVPVVLIMLPLIWFWLSRHQKGTVALNLPTVGNWRPAERRMLLVFGFTALAWVTRGEPFGGWSTWLNLPGANDASVAFLGVIILFLMPDGSGEAGEKGRLLDWETCRQIPWGVLLLFSGGICLAAGIKDSGLSAQIAGVLSGVGTLPLLGLVLTVCLLMTFLTELTSNTASTILIMPILALVALANDLDPLVVMLPAALSASCAFMLPVATAPNAVVFGTGYLTVPKMMREGVVLNLIGVVVIAFYCWLMG
ncbi:SLC13 family permease [bacterium]|nr:SLC13 family permease [bacterium]MDB4041338.1 SLC13 family permease [Akkermansiaceae bacterium]MDB4289135.1 SLC13 family permease [bacterium]MDB4316867.1 SLC13 family permease [Akkermansiaceae bacterium]MDC1405711.1 SLC13 family permease [Akkermansiaceae bacterium]